MVFETAERNVELIRLPVVGRVVPADGVVPWLVLDAAGQPVEPIRRFLVDFVARGNRAGSVRSYAYALHRWWRFLAAVNVAWGKATSAEVRDFVLWLRSAAKPRHAPRTKSLATAGRVNRATGKRYLDDRYQPRTIRHSNAVLRSFYDYWIELGGGPLVNPVPRDRPGGRRPNAHHNPLASFAPAGRLRYNPPIPKARPRAMPDERWVELFTTLGSNRDRALLALAISTAARASELLGIRGVDIDWGGQLVRVRRKGSGAEQWLPASPDAFVWLRLYLCDVDAVPADEPVWWTLRRRRHGAQNGGERRRHRPLNYEALRAVLRRANTALGTNWTMHDFRHTCALRMLRDKRLSVRDVQTILGHAHLTTTQTYLVEDDLEVITRVRAYLAESASQATQPGPVLPDGAGYDADDLNVLFGGTR